MIVAVRSNPDPLHMTGVNYADALAAALAKERKAELITGDPEFKALGKEIKIVWLN